MGVNKYSAGGHIDPEVLLTAKHKMIAAENYLWVKTSRSVFQPLLHNLLRSVFVVIIRGFKFNKYNE